MTCCRPTSFSVSGSIDSAFCPKPCSVTTSSVRPSITAGKARMDWSALPAPRGGWEAKLHLESVGMVSKLFKVEDDYISLLNQALCAQSAQMTTHEGARQRETRATFDAESRKASYLER